MPFFCAELGTNFILIGCILRRQMLDTNAPADELSETPGELEQARKQPWPKATKVFSETKATHRPQSTRLRMTASHAKSTFAVDSSHAEPL